MEKNKLMLVPLREPQGEKSENRWSNDAFFYNQMVNYTLGREITCSNLELWD